MSKKVYCVQGSSHLKNLAQVFDTFYKQQELVDVTLCCHGGNVKAHKIVLSACSTFFNSVLKDNPCKHPLIVLKDVLLREMEYLLEYIYNGELKLLETELPSVLRTAEYLEIKGLLVADIDEISTYDDELQCQNDQLEFDNHVNADDTTFKEGDVDQEGMSSHYNYIYTAMKNCDKDTMDMKQLDFTKEEERAAVKEVPISEFRRHTSLPRKRTPRKAKKTMRLVVNDQNKKQRVSISTEDLTNVMGDDCGLVSQSCYSFQQNNGDACSVQVSEDVGSTVFECNRQRSYPKEGMQDSAETGNLSQFCEDSTAYLIPPNGCKIIKEELDDAVISSENYLALCPFCCRSFQTASELTKHLKCHSGEKPYQCDMCTMTFTRQAHLKRHTRVHTGERPFHCSSCNKTFSRKDKLQQHVKRHIEEKKKSERLANLSENVVSLVEQQRQRAVLAETRKAASSTAVSPFGDMSYLSSLSLGQRYCQDEATKVGISKILLNQSAIGAFGSIKQLHNVQQ